MGNIITIPARLFEFFRVDMNWPVPNFTQQTTLSLKLKLGLWQMGSAIAIPIVGVIAKAMAEWLNKFYVYNREILYNALDDRPKHTPLVTVSNHNSCLDDPTLWGILKWRHILRPSKIRWSIAAHDICFTKPLHAIFFSLGKTVPVVRGNGVYQRALDFCIERLNEGEWVHIFPEGKVNVTAEFMRIKWGVGRLIAECKVCPVVIPMWHVGMDEVLPNIEPYRPTTGKVVTLVVGQPIELDHVLQRLKEAKKTDVEQRKTITDVIQEELRHLKERAEKLHLKMLKQGSHD